MYISIKLIISTVTDMLAGMFADISASVIVDAFKNRIEGKKKLEGVLEELGELESKSNEAVQCSYNASEIFNNYLSKAQELKSLIVGANKISLSRTKVNKCKSLYEEIDRKLLIYWCAFVQSVDISSKERLRYYYQYITPETTDIQKLISELIK